MAGPVVTDCSVAMSQEAADRAQRAVHDSPSAESSHDIEVAASGGRGEGGRNWAVVLIARNIDIAGTQGRSRDAS